MLIFAQQQVFTLKVQVRHYHKQSILWTIFPCKLFSVEFQASLFCRIELFYSKLLGVLNWGCAAREAFEGNDSEYFVIIIIKYQTMPSPLTTTTIVQSAHYAVYYAR